MSTGSKIEWTEATWNPVVGCSAVSEGCTHCYAATMTRRLEAMGKPEYAGLVGAHHFNGKVRCLPERLEQPLHWRKPRRVFVNSMSDLFHEDVPFEFVDQVFAVMALCPQHTFQVLTKRPERMAEYLCAWPKPRIDTLVIEAGLVNKVFPSGGEGIGWPPPNVWLGTSIENQETADERIPHLLRCPAAVRFLSVEPMLGAVELPIEERMVGSAHPTESAIGNRQSAISWVIVGGESGPTARPMHPDWARSIRDQCQAAGVPFFFKQWGAWAPTDDDNMPQAPWRHLRDDGAMGLPNGLHGPQVVDLAARPDECDSRIPGAHLTPNGNIVCMSRYGKKIAGRVLDGRTWDEYPWSVTT